MGALPQLNSNKLPLTVVSDFVGFAGLIAALTSHAAAIRQYESRRRSLQQTSFQSVSPVKISARADRSARAHRHTPNAFSPVSR